VRPGSRSSAREWKPGCPEWIVENGSPAAEAARRSVLESLIADDANHLPSLEMAKAWHRRMFEGIAPHPDYLGGFRDAGEVPYCLQDYNVEVGGLPGVSSDHVLAELDRFISEFVAKIHGLDATWPVSDGPPTQEQTEWVVQVAAWAHGEWVRIHPFANGNGRTSRLRTNYVLVRYGFGPALQIRPRPGEPYGLAARGSMATGDHRAMEVVIWLVLARSYGIA